MYNKEKRYLISKKDFWEAFTLQDKNGNPKLSTVNNDRNVTFVCKKYLESKNEIFQSINIDWDKKEILLNNEKLNLIEW